MDRATTEDDLLTAITEALTLYGYRWHHVRRSDKALQMGHAGFPDICAARNGLVWFIELKSEKGSLDSEQFAWSIAVEPWTDASEHVRWRVWHPSDLDAALQELA